MSLDAMKLAWGSDLKPGPRFVLVTLAEHGTCHDGEDPSCFPRVERLAALTGFDVKTVGRHLGSLWRTGWISRVRQRAHGRLGRWLFTIHLDAAVRSELGAVRASNDTPFRVDQEDVEPQVLPDNLSGSIEGAPSDNLSAPIGHFVPVLPDKLSGHREPPRLTPIEHPQSAGAGERTGASPGVGEDAPDPFGAAWNGWPEPGRITSSPREARSAWDAEVQRGGDPEALLAACRAYAGNRKAWGASGQPKSLHGFLATGRWTGHVGQGGKPAPGADPDAAPPNAFAGPPELRAALVALKGHGWCGSYLDPSRWDPGRRTLQPRSSTAAAKLAEPPVLRLLGEHQVTVERSGAGA